MELTFPGPSLPARRAAWRRWLRPAALLLLSLGFLAATISGIHAHKEDVHYNMIVSAVMLQVVAFSAAVVVLHARTECLIHLAGILITMWIGEAGLSVKYLLQCYGLKDYGLVVIISLGGLHGVGFGIQKAFGHNCLTDVESVLEMDLGSGTLYRMCVADLLLSILIILAAAAYELETDLEMEFSEVPRVLASLLCWAFLCIGIAFACKGYVAFGRVVRMVEETTARLEREKSRSHLWHQSGDEDVQGMFGRLRYLRRTVSSLCLIRLVVFGHVMLFNGFLWPLPDDLRAWVPDDMGLASQLLTDSECLAHLYYLCVLGVVWYGYGGLTSLVGIHARFQDEELRLLKRALQQTTYAQASDARWQATVEDLACRAITVDALLDFYAGLGREYMPGFNPEKHTTHDVVRQAIIPLSAEASSNLARLLMKGQRLLPNVMVSHTWRGRFRDLVAAVVADSLDEQEYGRIGNLLDSDIDLIKRWISSSHRLNRTYWICAFSVNQHASICAPTELQRDSVTGRQIPRCACGCPKFLNTDEPCRADGASIHCEMNKFGDMMAWLAAKDSSFTHVLAMDGDLDLLSRAWCVAEAAESYIMGMSQHMKVFSLRHIRRKWAKVKDLRVEHMEATRPEDVTEILQRIPNKAEFNTQLQKLFDRLFGQFWHLPPSERVRMMSRELRWRINVMQAMKEEAASHPATEKNLQASQQHLDLDNSPTVIWPQAL